MTIGVGKTAHTDLGPEENTEQTGLGSEINTAQTGLGPGYKTVKTGLGPGYKNQAPQNQMPTVLPLKIILFGYSHIQYIFPLKPIPRRPSKNFTGNWKPHILRPHLL
jgi:hypothetical protein